MEDEISQSTDSSVPDEGSFNNFIGPYATYTSPTVHLIVCLTVVTLMLIATFRPHNAGLHQVIVSIYWVELFVPPWLLVIGVSQTWLVVCGFRSKALSALWEEETDPSAVHYGRGRLSYCLIVGINAIGTYGFHELKLQPFLNTPIRPGIIRSGTKLTSLTETLTDTLVELRRLST